MSKEKMLKFWSEINWGGDSSSSASASEPQLATTIDADKWFRKPDKFLKVIRSLAREGRSETKKQTASEKDSPKIVWGQPDYVEHMEWASVGQPALKDDSDTTKSDAVSANPSLLDEKVMRKAR